MATPTTRELRRLAEATGGTFDLDSSGNPVFRKGGTFVQAPPGTPSKFQVKPGTTPQFVRKFRSGPGADFRRSVERARIKAQAQRRIAEARARLERQSRNRQQAIKIQFETQKKIAQIQKRIRQQQRGKSIRDRSRLQVSQRTQIENVLKSQAQKKVSRGLITRAVVSTREGRVVIRKTNGMKTTIEPTKRKPVVKKAKVRKVKIPKLRFPRSLDFPVPIFTAGAGSKSIKLKSITGGLFKGLERKGFSKKRIAGFTRLSDTQIDKLPRLSEEEKSNLKKVAKIQQDILVGGLKEIEEHPEKILVTTFLSAIAPGAIAKLGATPKVVKILKKIPAPIRRKGGKAISKILTGAYLTSAGLRIAKEPTGELRAERVGRILTSEVIPFQVGTRFGVRGLLKQELQTELTRATKGMSKSRQVAFKEYMKQAEAFGKFEPKAKNIKLNNVEAIPNVKSQKVIRKFLKGSKGNVVVGGSVAQTSQIKVGRKLGDMDLYVEKGDPRNVARQLIKQLKKAGVKRVSSILKKTKTGVRAEVRIEGKKTAEFHNIERLLTNIKQVTPSWRNPKAYIINTPEGIRIQRIGLQAQRKVVASFADPKRLKTGKYKKDLKDFKKISDEIFKNAVKKSRSAFFFKKKRLRRIGKIFKRKIPKVKKFKIRKIKRIKKFKKPRVLKKPVTKAPKKARVTKRITKAPKKTKVIRGRGKPKKISKKVKKIKKKYKPSKKPVKKIKFKPSQVPRGKRIRPSQPPRKPTKRRRFPPSQPPVRRRRVPRIPTPTRRVPPSQPPTAPPTKKPPFKPPVKTPPPKPSKKKRKKKAFIAGIGSIRTKKLKKAVPVFNVLGKSRGRFVRLNRVPLTRKDALDKGTFAVDMTTSATFKLVPAGKSKKTGRLRKGERNYFRRQGFKLREFRIKRGRKFKLKNKYIEKTRHRIDTKSEKAGLSIAKLLKQQRRGTIRRVVKRRITPTQRRNMLANLKRARKIRIQNLRVKPIRRTRFSVTPTKARKILKDKKIRGKPITRKQQRLFRSRVSGSPVKKRFIKGSKEAKQFMAKLRSRRR